MHDLMEAYHCLEDRRCWTTALILTALLSTARAAVKTAKARKRARRASIHVTIHFRE